MQWAWRTAKVMNNISRLLQVHIVYRELKIARVFAMAKAILPPVPSIYKKKVQSLLGRSHS